MIVRIDPPIPLATKRGRAWAHFVQDYGTEHPWLFGCFLCDGGGYWLIPQSEIRLEANQSLGIVKDPNF
jgi:hypothetical protein